MTIRFSCVVDEAAKFHQQAVVFVASAIVLAGISPDQIYVHVIGGRETSATRHLRGLGVTIVPCRPFDPAHPYCNKLLQLRSAPLQDADLLVLCDCDLAFAGPIGDALEGMRLRAKIVDCANPPLSILEGLFRSADFPGPLRTRKVDFSDDATQRNNCNGGLYVLPRGLYGRLAGTWPKWVQWLHERIDALEGYAMHSDQVAFALALEELGVDVDHLPPTHNYPTHLGSLLTDTPTPPAVLHYHSRYSLDRGLLPTGLANVDTAVGRVNGVILPVLASLQRESADLC